MIPKRRCTAPSWWWEVVWCFIKHKNFCSTEFSTKCHLHSGELLKMWKWSQGPRTWIPAWLHGKGVQCSRVWIRHRNCGSTSENGSGLVSACYESELPLCGDLGRKCHSEAPRQASWYKRLLQNMYFLIYWPRCFSFVDNKWILTFMLRTWHWCEIISCFCSQDIWE